MGNGLTIILPIKKEYSDLIFSGVKTVEYRRLIPKNRVEKILVYESRGSGRIVGEMNVRSILSYDPQTLWSKTEKMGGVEKLVYDEYFEGRKIAYAFELSLVKRYEESKDISEFGLKGAPQNFVIIKK